MKTNKTNLESLEEFIGELRESLPIPELSELPNLSNLFKQKIERPIGTLYNIHKRSMPIGTDKVLFIGLLRLEADEEILRLIHKESKRRTKEFNEVFYYFDIVPMNATDNEKSVFFNESPAVQV